MFSEPVALTYATVAKSLPRTGTNEDSSTYELVEAGGTSYKLELSQVSKARNRCVARLTRDTIVADPIEDSKNAVVSLSVTFTADWGPLQTPTDVQNLFAALRTFMSDANFLKLAGGET